MVVGIVFILALSKIALGLLTGGIEGFFALAQHSLLAVIGLLAGLSAWAAIPLGMMLFLTFFWLVRGYTEKRLWRRLEKVREEYTPLLSLLKRRGLKVYVTQLEKVREKLFSERNRIEDVQGLLDEELPRIESRLADLDEQLKRVDEEDERNEFREIMRELAGNSSRLRKRRGDLEEFDKAKTRVASRLNCLRQRLTELPVEGADVKGAMEGLDSISLMEDMFQPSTQERETEREREQERERERERERDQEQERDQERDQEQPASEQSVSERPATKPPVPGHE